MNCLYETVPDLAAEHPLLPHLCLRKAPALLGRMRRPQIKNIWGRKEEQNGFGKALATFWR
jgi:hypothetical protein